MNRPNRTGTDSSDPGAAQFLHGLEHHQIQHLRFSVPLRDAATRFSQFLEGPRTPPIPHRFTFHPQPPPRPGANSNSRLGFGAGRSTTTPASNGRSTITPAFTEITERSTAALINTGRSTATLLEKVWKKAPELKTVDWGYYSTVACLCLLNLMAAWEATTLSVALPVRSSSYILYK